MIAPVLWHYHEAPILPGCQFSGPGTRDFSENPSYELAEAPRYPVVGSAAPKKQ